MLVLKGIGKKTKITKYVTGGLASADHSKRQANGRGIRGYGFTYSEDLQDAMVFENSQQALAMIQTTVDNTNKRNTTLELVEVEIVASKPVLKELKAI